MNTLDNISSCSSLINIDLQKIEQRKTIYQFMIRQLEIIEEQAYLVGQETAGQTIFQAIQYLESVDCSEVQEIYAQLYHE